MFTGIVNDVGQIRHVEKRRNVGSCEVQSHAFFSSFRILQVGAADCDGGGQDAIDVGALHCRYAAMRCATPM